MDNTAFKVLKLRSGDDIIARLIKNTKEFIRLERPMVLKVMHYVEPMSSMKKETIILYDWMKVTTSNNIDKNHIKSHSRSLTMSIYSLSNDFELLINF